MSMTLWTGEDDTIDLGDPLKVLQSFGAMARVDEGDDYPELFSVPGFAEQDVDPDWLAKVRTQATAFLNEYRDRLGEFTVRVLETLALGASPNRVKALLNGHGG